jgi:ATP-binding cassette subfamily B protein
MEKSAALNSQIIDSIKGIETVKSFGVENDTLEKMENKYIQSIRVGYKISVTSNIQGVISGFFGNIGNLVLMGVAALFVMNGDITLGSMFAFMSLSSYFMDPIGRLVGLQMQIQEAQIAMKRMSELYDLEPEQSNTENLINSTDLDGDIKIANVTFRYGNRSPVLKDVSFSVKKGSKIALVGESGGGKTTLAKIILGLWQQEAGTVSINNYNIDELDKKFLRQYIAYVPQNVELFSGTITENIKIGKPDATYEEIKTACVRAGCAEFIEKMPIKYGTYLDEAGANLSGGERQRIALARALIKNPKILILDEATSNLDFMSEAKIYETLFNLDCTVIIIAHRLSTVRRCDNIIVIDKNTVAENGTHDNLLKQDGIYHKIWASQIGDDIAVSNTPKVKEKKPTEKAKAISKKDEITYS